MNIWQALLRDSIDLHPNVAFLGEQFNISARNKNINVNLRVGGWIRHSSFLCYAYSLVDGNQIDVVISMIISALQDNEFQLVCAVLDQNLGATQWHYWPVIFSVEGGQRAVNIVTLGCKRRNSFKLFFLPFTGDCGEFDVCKAEG